MSDTGRPRGVDFHNHVLPGVDDGAADLSQALDALRAFLDEDVGTVVATPHFPASLFERPEAAAERLARFDKALVRVQDAVDLQGLPVRLERGAEVRLDAPEPDLSDPRIRLAGTRFVLVEFSHFTIPPFGGRQLEAVRRMGWTPVLAHPERYAGAAVDLDRIGRWRDEGTWLQVNAGSLLGEYGEGPRRVARALLERGWVDYLCSDYHSRGEPGVAAARQALRRARPAEEEPAEDEPTPEPSALDPATSDGDRPAAADTDAAVFPDADPRAPAPPGADADPLAGPDAGADPPAGPDADAAAAVEEAVERLTVTNAARLLEGEDPLPVPALVFGRGVWDRVRSLLGS